MSENHLPLIFDGHNDLLFRLFEENAADPSAGFLNGRAGHIDLPKAKLGGFGGGFFAIYVPSPDELIDTLTLNMNRIRQADITREIIEVVSGAAAQ